MQYAEGRRVRRTSKDSLEKRIRTKLLGSSSWFRKKGGQKSSWRKGTPGQSTKRTERQSPKTDSVPRTVLFVDQTPGGELALRLRELLARIEDTIGFKVKVVGGILVFLGITFYLFLPQSDVTEVSMT